MNGCDVDDPNERLYDAMIEVASGKMSKTALGNVLRGLAIPASDD